MTVNSHLVCVDEEKDIKRSQEINIKQIIKEIKREPSSKMSIWWSSHWRALLSELVATTLLIFFGCMTCIPLDGLSANMPLYSPLGFGLVIVFTVQSFGHISGALMNPAVSLAAVIWGRMSVTLGIAYSVAQCFGAIIGYGLLMGLSTVDMTLTGLCTTQPHITHTVFQALGVEIAFTAAIGFITCSMWDPVNEEKNEANSLKFGLAVAGLAVAGGPLAGASMNPARSLGPALWTSRWTSHWVYWFGPLVGAAVAATFYKFVWLKVPVIKETIIKKEILTWTDNGEV